MTVVLVVAAVTGWGLALALLIGRGIRLADLRQTARSIDAVADDVARLREWLAGPGARPTRIDRERWDRVSHFKAEWWDAEDLAHAYADDPDGLEAFARREILAGRMSTDTLRRARALAEALR